MELSPFFKSLGLRYPIFQGGMAWVADGKLAAAVSMPVDGDHWCRPCPS
ncbi:hypothetical protein Q757_03485 [Oenococcus alcoholitolerans]|uniref:Nitronate monooxygenase domain-containing protein n=1 Tax=Oenococcus alcoholitolerans TaxID=931074 RepID=A0ABR4XRC1_9LACO|nr:hypothetical protein Q757_03485 [Oenococcus alcoholitolerans]